MQGGTLEPTVVTFTDSGSTSFSLDGLVAFEVKDGNGKVCGGGLYVGGDGWASLLTYVNRGTPAPNPTFTDGAAVTVTTAGATGQTITVRARRVCATANVSATR